MVCAATWGSGGVLVNCGRRWGAFRVLGRSRGGRNGYSREPWVLLCPSLFVIGRSCGCLRDSGIAGRLSDSDAAARDGLQGCGWGSGGVLVGLR